MYNECTLVWCYVESNPHACTALCTTLFIRMRTLLYHTYFLYIVIFTGFLYSCICYGEKGFPCSSYIFAFAIVNRINTVDMALRDVTRICGYEQYRQCTLSTGTSEFATKLGSLPDKCYIHNKGVWFPTKILDL